MKLPWIGFMAWTSSLTFGQVTFEDKFLQAPFGAGFTLGDETALGDVNGDGETDIVFGASGNLSVNGANGGAGWIFYGPDYSAKLAISPLNLASADHFGLGGWKLIDLNGDGFDDLIGGAALSDFGGLEGSGRAFVGYGPDFTQWVELQRPNPSYAYQAFSSQLDVGDFTGDGILDVLVGTEGYPGKGRIDIYSGATGFAGPPFKTLQPPDPASLPTFWGWGKGLMVADIDGDGVQDIMTTEDKLTPYPGTLFYMKGGKPSNTVWLPNPIGTGTGYYGTQLRFEDLDADGYRDVISRATSAQFAGAIIVFHGPAYSNHTVIQEPSPQAQANFGNSFGIGDVNRDGWLDVVGGAPNAKIGDNPMSGRVTICFGPDFQQFQQINGVADAGLRGLSMDVLDVDADGFAELFVGAPYEAAGIGHLFRHRTLRVTQGSSVSISSGGSASLAIECGKLSAQSPYLVLLSLSGSEPGIDVPSSQGPIHLPLNIDATTSVGLLFVNTPVFAGFQGVLDADGNGTAMFTLPGGAVPPALAGVTLTFAAVLGTSSIQYATHAATVTLTP